MTPDECNPPRRRCRVQSFRHTLANQVLGTLGASWGSWASRGEPRPSNLSLWVRHWLVILAQRGVCLGEYGGVSLDREGREDREGRDTARKQGGTTVEGGLEALAFTGH